MPDATFRKISGAKLEYLDPSAEQDIESVGGSNSGQSGCKTGTRPVCKYNNRVISLKTLENKASEGSG